MTPREPEATDGRGRRRGRAEEPTVPSEETGWLDDLRSAKKSKDRLSAGDDLAEDGSSRWAKLRALSDDPDAPAPSARRGRPAEELAQRVPGAARPVSGGPQQPTPSRRGSSDRSVSPAGPARHGSSDAPVNSPARAAPPPAAPPPAGRRHAADEPQTQPPLGRWAQPDAPVSPPPADRRPARAEAAHQAAEESAQGKHSGGAPSSDPLVRPTPASRGEGGPKRQLPEQDPVRPVRHGKQPPSGLPPQLPRTGNHAPVPGAIPDARAGAAGAPPAKPTVMPGPAGATPRRAEPSRGPAAPRSAVAAGPGGPMARPTSPADGGSAPNGPGGTGSGPAGVRNVAAGTGGAPATGPTAGRLPGGAAVAGLPTGVPTGSGPAGRPVSSAAPRAAHPGTPSDPAGPASTGRTADAATPTVLPGPVGEAPGGPGRGGRAGLAAGVDAIRGARSEVRRQLREQQRLRMWTLIATVVMVVGALPLYFLLRAATRDPVLTGLDALQVPDWATGETVDNLSGSRWCLMECRYRERTSKSEREMGETFKAYQTALAAAGWNRWKSQACPTEVDGGPFSCWRRDEYTMEIWVRQPACMTDPMYARPTIKPTKESDAAPGAEPTDPAAQCFGSVVTIKVMNAIADDKYLHQEAPAEQPLEDELTDEDLEDSPSPTP